MVLTTNITDARGQVFGFAWREQKEKAQQEFVTVPEYLLGKVVMCLHFVRIQLRLLNT
jgi:hypothetical protein